MSELCFARTSCWRIGSAEEEISTERGSLPCSCSATTLVILPFLTVTLTWAAPYCVSTAVPVAVPDTPDDELEDEPDDPEPDEPLPDEAPEPLVDVLDVLLDADAVDAVAVCTAGACAWKARMPAVPATVAVRTMGDRRMGSAPDQKVNDSKWIRGPGTPARSS